MVCAMKFHKLRVGWYRKYRRLRWLAALCGAALLTLMVAGTAYAAVTAEEGPAVSFSRNAILAIVAGVALILIAAWRSRSRKK